MEASSKLKYGPAGSPRPWRMEHRDLTTYSVYGDYVQEADKWVVWNTQYVLDKALEKLIEMSTKRRLDPKGQEVRFYSYRIRNVDTGEVIPGELFE